MAKNNSGETIDRIDRFHKTKKGRLSFGIAEILVAYLFLSLAINSGSLWQYAAAVILFIGAANNLVRAFALKGVKTDGRKSAKKR